LRPEGPREPGSATCEMKGSRDLSGRNVFIVPPPRASASGLSPGLESPGPLGRWSRSLYKSGQFRRAGVAEDIITVNPILSQSLNTDQGSSDWFFLWGPGKSNDAPSQSLNTDQGSSDPTPSKALQ
jgi:hypothetical protein